MSTTIFCTFDHQDLADLAMGDLRATITGVKSIHYMNGYNSRGGMLNAGTAAEPWAGIFPARATMSADTPARPVNIRIVCSDASAKAVKSRLVNLRAYQIVTMR